MAPINPEIAAIMEKMEPRHVALLVLKILNPDQTLTELAQDVWPEVQYDMRRRHIADSGVSRIIDYVSKRPYQLGLLLNSKLMPVAVAVLFKSLSANKENVRVTAAKEIIRLAQTSASRLFTDPDEPGPAHEEQEKLLASMAEAKDGGGEGTT